MAQRAASLFTPEQRDRLRGIPPEFSDREIARYYTFTPADLAAINRRRRGHNRLGFAVQLAMLRFPGRTLVDLGTIPPRVLAYLAHQVDVPSSTFGMYGQRENTVYEHLDEIRTVFGYTNYDWRAMRRLMTRLLPLAMESDRSLPLAEAALDYLRTLKVIAPGITTLENLIQRVRRRAEHTVYRRLAQTLADSQQAVLDAMLVTPTRGRYSGLSRLAWLRIGPGNPSAAQLQHILDRMTFLQELDLPPMPPQLHRNRILQLARRGTQYQAGPLASFAAEKRYALLFASVSELSHDLIDQSLAMFDDLWIELLRKGEASQTKQVVTHARALNRDVYLLAAVLEAIAQAERDGTDPFAAVYALVHRDKVATTIARIRGMLRPPDFDYLDLVGPKYLPLRQALLRFIRLLTFQPFRTTDPALLALHYVLRLEQRNTRVTSITTPTGRTTQTAPLAHLTDRWRPYVLAGTQIEPTYYEAAAFDQLRSGLRSGDIAVAASRRYQAFDSYLLPKTYWDQLCATGMTRLAENSTAQAYLEERADRIHTQLVSLQQELGPESGLTLADDGTLHLAALEAVVPTAAKTLSRRAYRLLPRINLPDLLREVNEWTGFLDQATHLTTELPLFRDESTTLLAALMGTGMNLSLTSLAKASPFTYRQLAWASDWYLREDTLRSMLVTLDNFVLRQPFARMWGDGTRSSSDGLRLRVGVQAPNADRNSHYFDDGRGITLYLHLADMGPPLYNQVISTNESEAWYVIDGLCNHETEFNIEEHSTDTGGSRPVVNIHVIYNVRTFFTISAFSVVLKLAAQIHHPLKDSPAANAHCSKIYGCQSTIAPSGT